MVERGQLYTYLLYPEEQVPVTHQTVGHVDQEPLWMQWQREMS